MRAKRGAKRATVGDLRRRPPTDDTGRAGQEAFGGRGGAGGGAAARGAVGVDARDAARRIGASGDSDDGIATADGGSGCGSGCGGSGGEPAEGAGEGDVRGAGAPAYSDTPSEYSEYPL